MREGVLSRRLGIVVVMLFCFLVLLAQPVIAESVRYVPQPDLTAIAPRAIVYHPSDATMLLVVNLDGRIDLLDINDPDRPVKTTEIQAIANQAAFSPQGDRIVSAGIHGTVRLWNIDGSPAAEPFEGHEGPVWSVAFSPLGDLIASGGNDGTVRLWTLDGAPAAAPFRGHDREVVSVAFSPLGDHIVSVGFDGAVRQWTLDGTPVGEAFRALEQSSVSSVAFSSQRDRVAVGGSDGMVRLWNLDGTPAAEQFQAHYGWGMRVAFSPRDNRIATAGEDGTLQLWTPNGEMIAEPFRGHDSAILSIAFSPTGDTIASAGSDGTIRLWHQPSIIAGRPIRALNGAAFDVAFHPAGDRLVAAYEPGVLVLYTFRGWMIADPIRGHNGPAVSVAFTPQGDLIASGGVDGSVRLWASDGTPMAEPFSGHAGSVIDVAFDPSGDRIATAGVDGAVRLWTIDGAPAAEAFRGHDGPVSSVSFNARGDRIVSAGYDGTVRLWSLDGTPLAEPFRGHDGRVLSIVVSPRGDHIASGGEDGTVRLWTLDGTPAAEPFRGHDGAVHSVGFDHRGYRIVSAGEDGTVRLWALDGTPLIEPLSAHSGIVTAVAFSPGGDRIVSSGVDGAVRLWNLEGGQISDPLRGSDSDILNVSVSRTGNGFVSITEDGGMNLWLSDGSVAAQPLGEADIAVTHAAFAPEGDLIVSSGDDGSLRRWHVDGTPAGEPILAHDSPINNVVFAPGGNRIGSVAIDGSVRLWFRDGTPASEPFQRQDPVPGFSSGTGGDVFGIGDVVPGDDPLDDGGFDDHDSGFEHFRILRLRRRDNSYKIGGGGGGGGGLGLEGGDVLAFSPLGDLIATAGRDGTVRLWSLTGTPVGDPFRGHEGRVTSVAFNPAGDRIVSTGMDRTVRLWSLNGTVAASPFRGHLARVTSAVFTPEGDRVLSASDDGTVRNWTLDGTQIAEPYRCADQRYRSTLRLQPIGDGGFAVWCTDRLVVLDGELHERGTVLLNPNGLVAITSEGVFAPTDDLQYLVRAVADDGSVLARRGAVAQISAARLRQILLDQYTFWEYLLSEFRIMWRSLVEEYRELGWGARIFVWPALVWFIVALMAVLLMVVTPARLAHMAMPVTGAPPPPPWQWLLQFIVAYRWLGQRRRPLRAWLWRRRREIDAAAFLGRDPVRERTRYYPLSDDSALQAFVQDLAKRRGVVCWIEGVGGSGKSALAFDLVRRVLKANHRAPVPVLVDADWKGSLAAEVARQLRPPGDDREPTEEMARTLGAGGLVCPIVDALSERGAKDATQLVTEAVQQGDFRSIIVTSRLTPPAGPVWEKCLRIRPSPIRRESIPLFIRTYAPEAEVEILGRLSPLIEQDPLPSPLFLRFAIQHAVRGPLVSTDRLNLVLDYIEELRGGRIDLSPSDMLRAASLAAIEAVRENGVPRELDRLHLRGALQAAADSLPFMDGANSNVAEPSAIIDRLVEAGILNETRTSDRLQFAYDPVAEFLAARWLRDRQELETLRRSLLATDNALSQTFREITSGVALGVAG